MFAFLWRRRSLLAQLVEHYLDKVGVSSSSLLETTIFFLNPFLFRWLSRIDRTDNVAASRPDCDRRTVDPDLYRALLAVLTGVGGVETDHVLITQVIRNAIERRAESALLGPEHLTACHPGQFL